MSLHPCTSCRRHVNVRDVVCPFCGAEQPPRPRTLAMPVALGRISRAAVFAGLSACWTSSSTSAQEPPPPPPDDKYVVPPPPDNPMEAASLSGVVTQGNGVPAPNASVRLWTGTGAVYSTNADQDGRYQLLDIPSGDYQLVAQYSSVAEVGSAQQPVSIRDRPVTLDIHLSMMPRGPTPKPYGAPPARRRVV